MNRTFAFVAVLLTGCVSSVTLDVDGGLSFPCTPGTTGGRTQGNCPGSLFCGADRFCHSSTVPGAYACREDFDCVEPFRCGPSNVCIDPRADALRASPPDVTLSVGKTVVQETPWKSGMTALAIGPTFARFYDGPLADVSPLAVAKDRDIFSVAISRQGFTATMPPARIYQGRATLPKPVIDLAVVRDQVWAITDAGLYIYQWDDPQFDGGAQVLDAGAPIAAIGDRLRVGNSAFPYVAEFSAGGAFRLLDSDNTNLGRFTNLGNLNTVAGRLDDMVDTDGQLYAAKGGVLLHAARPDFSVSSNAPNFTTVPLVSPGRDQLLTNCGGKSVKPEDYYIRRIHVGNNPDLSQLLRPLVALSVDVTGPDGGRLPSRWMRVDPEPATHLNCTDTDKHIVRGNCETCSANEELVDLQWGLDSTGQPALRSECQPNATDGGTPEPTFYELQTDPTGFLCFKTRRPGAGYRGRLGIRARSSATVAAVSSGEIVYTRREGFDPYTPLTLERPPIVAQQFDGRLGALGARTMYVETPGMGLALAASGENQGAFPAWISGRYLFYDDGRVGPIENLAQPLAAGALRAIPSQNDLKGPIRGFTTRGSDGRNFIVMTANDALLGADLSEEPVASLDVKVVPEAQVKIVSVATTPTDAGLFAGYVLTENRLWVLNAENVQQWTSSELDVPAGERREVWADQDRGRLGYSDGVVYSLPSRVPIALKLDRPPVVDYQHFCGRSYALTQEGLYRLETPPLGGKGTWRREEQDGGVAPPRKWASLYTYNDELWAFAQDGSGVMLKGAPCTP